MTNRTSSDLRTGSQGSGDCVIYWVMLWLSAKTSMAHDLFNKDSR